MDFASVERALQSLGRRHPPLAPQVLETAANLLKPDIDPQAYVEGVVTLLSYQDRWEPLAVGLYLATEVLQQAVRSDKDENDDKASSVYVEGPRVPSTTVNNQSSQEQQQPSIMVHDTELLVSLLCGPLLQTCREHLEHAEPRVRTLVAKAVGAHVRLACRLPENQTLQQERRDMHSTILNSLFQHLEAGRDSTEKYSQSSTGALDDTTGWRALETNWQGLASYVAACGSLYLQEHQPTTQLYEACEYSCITHVNRHVRAAGIAFLEQVVIAAAASSETSLSLDPDSDLQKTVVKVLKVTLADNWSQVRMAASVLCRTFWLSLQQQQVKNIDIQSSSIYPVLLPRMCLNRFYLAQGVKLYSHDTWRMVFREKGLEAVAQNAGPVCRYYVQMCDADNHVVREAACQAVAELASKLGNHADHAESLQPFVPMLLQALLMCFHDESWPVRDEACLACGTFCVAYPEECRPELPTLTTRWAEQLTDQIWSVREDAAVAMGDALQAFPELLSSHVLPLIQQKLPSAREQPAMTMQEYKQKQNDMESHTDSQLYSCGSLAPKLRKGGAGRIGGCSSCGITRPKAPWEATDGCIYMLRELMIKCSPDVLTDAVLLPLFTEMMDVCRVRHFPQADDLRATLWRQLPVMAKALGKQRFKRIYLELVTDLLMNNLESRSSASALSVHAAGQCAEELAHLVGISIFKGRLDEYQRQDFDRAMMERQHSPKGPAMMDNGVSPFGPGVSPLGPSASPFGPGVSPVAPPSASPFSGQPGRMGSEQATQRPPYTAAAGNRLTEAL